MGGTTEPIITALNESYSENVELADAVKVAVDALRAGITSASNNATPPSEPRVLGPSTLEVAILDVNRPRRAFRRITGAALENLLPKESPDSAAAPEGDSPD
jgi:proteasome alpha subunit